MKETSVGGMVQWKWCIAGNMEVQKLVTNYKAGLLVLMCGASAIAAPTRDSSEFHQAQATARTAMPEHSEDGVATKADAWPQFARLQYKVSGRFRGRLNGTADLRFNSDGNRYKSQLNVDVGLSSLKMTSAGGLSQNAIFPRSFQEASRAGQYKVTSDGKKIQFYIKDIQTPQPKGVLDSISQLWALQRYAQTKQWQLEVGNSYNVWLMRPEGLFYWAYQIQAKEQVQLPSLGSVTAYKIQPKALGRGTTKADIWLAPSLNYLPVRIQMQMANNSYVNMLLESYKVSR